MLVINIVMDKEEKMHAVDFCFILPVSLNVSHNQKGHVIPKNWYHMSFLP